MTKKQREEEQIKVCREVWFPNHKAKIKPHTHIGLEPETVHVLDWRNPASGNYWMRYIISGRSLIVIGDAGDAVFEWGENITWEFLSQCDLHYFSGKCRASEHGGRYKTWDHNIAESGLRDYAIRNECSKEQIEAIEDTIQWGHTASRDEFLTWVADCDAFPEGEDKSALLECGEVLDARCIGMWVGLQMAKEQLRD